MTNLEVIKYLATNNPTRLAEFIDDVWCIAWNRGASVQHLLHIGDESGAEKVIDSDLEFSESKWLEQEADTGFFFDRELEGWSKEIKPSESTTDTTKHPIDHVRFRKSVCAYCSDLNCMRSQAEICDCHKFRNYY